MLIGLVLKITKRPTISGSYKKKTYRSPCPPFLSFSAFLLWISEAQNSIAHIVSSAQSLLATHGSSCVFICFAFVSFISLLQLPPLPSPSPHRQTFLCCQCVSVRSMKIYIATYTSSICQTSFLALHFYDLPVLIHVILIHSIEPRHDVHHLHMPPVIYLSLYE